MLPPSAAAGILSAGTTWVDGVRLLLETNPSPSTLGTASDHEELAFVHVLWTKTDEYLGKTVASRRSATSTPGLAARCQEHIRALRKPGTREGRMARYVDMRAAFGSLGFLPVCAFGPSSGPFSPSLPWPMLLARGPTANSVPSGPLKLPRGRRCVVAAPGSCARSRA